MKSKIALIVVFNHHYIENITRLERIYSSRFTNIFFLVPFYKGTKENIIPVFENSFYFQGYITQAYSRIYNEKFNHYLFIADDLLLNPAINEDNAIDFFNVDDNKSFIPELLPLHKAKGWPRLIEAIKYNTKVAGIELKDQIPTIEEALQKFKSHNLEVKPLVYKNIFTKIPAPSLFNPRKLINTTYYTIKRHLLKNKQFSLNYPLIGGYSDILLLNKKALSQFSFLCGVFAATNLFVELAIPTSMVLSCQKIITEKELKMKGKPLWSKNDFQILDIYNSNLTKLLSNFPEDLLYIHPIKLSKWKD